MSLGFGLLSQLDQCVSVSGKQAISESRSEEWKTGNGCDELS